MDIVKTSATKNRLFQRKGLLLTGFTITFLVLGYSVFKATSSAFVLRDEILVEKVLHGDLEVLVEGYGTLRSDKQQLLSSRTRAMVKEIVLKPGAEVTKNSVIVLLENPELQREAENAQQALAQVNANLRQLKLNQKTTLLNESEKMEEALGFYEKAKLIRIAYDKLAKSGVMPSIKYQEVVVDEQQWAKRKELLAQRITQLTLVHKEEVNIELERIKQYKGLLASAQARLQSLEVRAGIDGVLQRLSVELGQSLDVGQEIALIGSVSDLVALIRVPQNQAQSVEIGQKVIVSTRSDKIDGVVFRIDPVVDNNTVEIEVTLPAHLPQSARPQLNVDATIIADALVDITYIRRPNTVHSNSRAELYRLHDDQKYADRQSLKFGRRAGDYIEVLAGARVNDLFIVSDLSNLKNNPEKLDIKL